ncbi:class I SAM-dependent methyltransferase [Caulobacter segnis]
MTQQAQYAPALGRPELTGLYDLVVSLVTREHRWRAALLRGPGPAGRRDDHRHRLRHRLPGHRRQAGAAGARVIGVDPDPAVLAIARAKAQRAGVTVDWIQGLGDQADTLVGQGVADAVISSLVLHQCDEPVKAGILRAMARLSRPGARVLIADYGRQRGLMRLLFRIVQAVDGHERTEFNAVGALPGLMRASGLTAVTELDRIATPTGSISLYATRAG